MLVKIVETSKNNININVFNHFSRLLIGCSNSPLGRPYYNISPVEEKGIKVGLNNSVNSGVSDVSVDSVGDDGDDSCGESRIGLSILLKILKITF